MSTLIRNGTVVTATETRKADVLIEGERISQVGEGLAQSSGGRVIDATGMYVMPGGIDVHTHLDMPLGDIASADDFETGTRAAAFGGTTSIVDFATQARGTRMRDALDTWWKKAEGRASIDYGLHMIVTDLANSGLEDMDEMVAEGVASFKLFMAYPNVADGGRRHHLQGALADGQERRAGLHARRKRRRDRRPRRQGAGRG